MAWVSDTVATADTVIVTTPLGDSMITVTQEKVEVRAVTYGVWLRAMRDTIMSWEGEREVPDGSNRHRGGNISRVQIDGAGFDGMYYCSWTVWRAALAAADALDVVCPLPRTGRVSTMFTYANSPMSPLLVYSDDAVHNNRSLLPELYLFGYGRNGTELVPGNDGPGHIGMGEEPKGNIIPTHEGNRQNKIMGGTIPIAKPDAYIVFDMDKPMQRKGV